MARPANVDASVTRARILDASLELFAERGFFGTSMRQIGTAAGVTGSALYHHFESKEEILHALFREMTERVDRQVITRAAQDLPASLPVFFRRMCGAVFDIMETPMHKKFMRILQSDGYRLAQDGVVPPEMLGHGPRMRLAEALGGLMERGVIRKMEPTSAALAIMGPMFLYRHARMTAGKGLPGRATFLKNHVDCLVRAFTP